MSIRTIHDQLELKGKRVLVRVDFNLPMDENGKITDTTRLEATEPTIRYLIQKEARVILLSHLGRPKPNEHDERLKMDEVAKTFSQIFKIPIKKMDKCFGKEVDQAITNLKNGEVILLENTRFHCEEEKNDPQFTKTLASYGDLFVNDAFGAAHRAHSSNVGIADFLPTYAGFLLEKEIKVLTALLETPERPLVFLVGGAKIDTKIGVLEHFLGKADTVLVGGGLANTFIHASGYDVGNSLCEKDKENLAKRLMAECVDFHERFLIPTDVIVSDKIAEDAKTFTLAIENVPKDLKILDIGPKTIEKYLQIIQKAKTVVWNGPPGLYEFTPFARGTKSIAKGLSNLQTTTILGGGDTVDAIRKFGHSFKEFSHVSTGGGAMLEFLEGKELPGVKIVTMAK
ncbi:TPA: phosphoglycerate kinase [Candidatus Peregrinibacteria bacterium]|nr:phosphoglycerate kinase [Candidatus Peregrinibacteria bacterium]